MMVNTEDGASAVEYALIVVAIAAVVVVVVVALGLVTKNSLAKSCGALDTSFNGANATSCPKPAS